MKFISPITSFAWIDFSITVGSLNFITRKCLPLLQDAHWFLKFLLLSCLDSLQFAQLKPTDRRGVISKVPRNKEMANNCLVTAVSSFTIF